MSGAVDGEVIGTSPGEVAIHRSRTDSRVQLSSGAVQTIATRLSGAVGKNPTEHVYLALDGIRGTQDASALSVYLLPASDGPAEFFAGTVGLYGLRRASVRTATGSAHGLRFVLDVTPFFRDVIHASASRVDEVIVSIRLRRELPVTAAVVIGRIVLFHKDHGVEQKSH
jgi:tyrosinase